MANQRIIFVEPSFYGVSFVKEAKALGCEVVVIASSADNPQLYGYEGLYDDLLVADIRDAESIYQAIVNSPYHGQFDALIPATDYASAVTAEAGERLGIHGTSFVAASNARNKDLARQAFLKDNVPSAKFAVVRDSEEAVIAAVRIGYPVVLKPTNAASSQSVYFVENESVLRDAFREIIDFKTTYMDFKVREEYLIEEYLTGPEFSVEIFLSQGEIAFAEITEKHTSDLPYFVETLHVFPSSIYQEQRDQIIDVAKQAVLSIGIQNGPTHVELKYTQDGPKIIEVNGRPGGDNITSDLIVNAYGINIFKETILKYLAQPLDIDKKKYQASAIGYLVADRKGTVRTITGLEHLHHENVKRYQIDVQAGSDVDIARSSDDRLGYIIVEAATPIAAKHKVEELLGQIQISYAE
ncbi:biotin carboxylase [Paenibacillus sp. SORGH_AS306]|uniref:ATP-grasp domain-containing protein n=1 Tax=unclassified Paenibacillus TaxID=185978 RepID=UPI0027807AF9|nr:MULTISPECIES: ATP-grasp domain-containing protein [unclassified Paenibacillus]MDQ1236123.1 biotin carboxylase [Paenibacillus sp. SORGH_AS_0306]MDR6108478.1 biotin carboxylase [Paenibacillus sp. SORGH_AS_0338]